MAGTYVELDLQQGNDETVEHTVTNGDTGAPFNLAGASAIELYLKPSAATSDTDPAVVKLTLAAGAVTIVNASAGRCNTAIPASALTAAGSRWWRLDLVVSGKRKTAMYGLLVVRDT